MQENGDREVEALRAAFEALLAITEPRRQAAILRQALKALIEDEPDAQPRQSPARFGEGVAAVAADRQRVAARWSRVRGELRERLQHGYGSLAAGAKELAPAVGIARSRVVRLLCPISTCARGQGARGPRGLAQ